MVIRQVSPRVFLALQNLDVEKLLECSEEEIRPIMPCLARMSLISPLDQSQECVSSRRTVFRILSGLELVNSLVGLLSTDFHALEVDVKKEQLLRYTWFSIRFGINLLLTFGFQTKTW